VPGCRKYSKDEGAAAAAISAFLMEHGVEPAIAQRVLAIIASVGFKEELAVLGSGAPGAGLSLEAAVVQDADRWVSPACVGEAALAGEAGRGMERGWGCGGGGRR
jgi:hypothetical protein